MNPESEREPRKKTYRPSDSVPRVTTGDPTEAGGDIAGPGGPRDHNSVVLDTTHGVLLDHMTAAVGHNRSDGRDFVGVLLEGRINHKSTRTRILYLTDGDGLAALITELESLVHRMDSGPLLRDFLDAYEKRSANLRAQGLLPSDAPDHTEN